MNRALPLLLALALVGCGKSGSTSADTSQEITPTATVRTAQLERAPLSTTVTAYGTVVAQPGELESISVQYESKVVHLFVSAGQAVENGQPLIAVEPSPDAKLALQQAETAANSALSQLEETRKRFRIKLAVNTELQQAEQTAKDAADQLASLQQRGADARATLKSDLAGIVSTIDARMGQIVAAGTSLLSIVPERQIEVRLGVEPEDAGRLQVGEKVSLFAVNQDGVETTGEIRLVTRRVNPQTRLIDTFVAVPPDAPLLLDGYMRGEIVVEKKEALVVPRDAVLPGPDGSVLYTVRDGHAVAHKITTGLETDTETEVLGGGLNPGDEVVVQGNYQLEDGMAVNVSK